MISIHLLQVEICTLFVTWPHKTTLIDVMYIYGWELIFIKSLMLHQKHESYKYVLPLKNWVDWITTRQVKNVTTSKMYILRRSAQKLKKHIFSLFSSLPYITLLLRWKPVELKRSLSPFWELETSVMVLCMFGLFISG